MAARARVTDRCIVGRAKDCHRSIVDRPDSYHRRFSGSNALSFCDTAFIKILTFIFMESSIIIYLAILAIGLMIWGSISFQGSRLHEKR